MPWIILLNLFLISPILIYDLRPLDDFAGLTDGPFYFTLLVSVLFLAAFQLLFKRPWKFHLLIFPLYVTVLVELFLIVVFKSRLTTSYLAIILSEFAYTADFLATYQEKVLIAFGLFIPGYAFLLWKARRAEIRAGAHWALVPALGLALVYVGTTVHQMRVIPADFSRAWIDVLSHDKNSPFGIFSQGYMAWRLQAEAERKWKARRDFRFDAKKTGASTSGTELQVLVLGETSRPDHWGINGYHRDTSPRLARVENLVTFRNAIAEVALTQKSVPLILSRATIEDFDDRQGERSVISAFREVGYTTYWLTTQQWDTFTANINHYAMESDQVRYFERRYDEVLLGELDHIIENLSEGSKTFVVLHTQGSHMRYSMRYPHAFRMFPESGDLSRREYMVNTYDNSIVYTDYFLSEVIKRLEAFEGISTMLYLGDHGENLSDDERELYGHYHNNEYDLPIAMFFWGSIEFAEAFPSKLANARRNANRPVTTANVFYTLLDAAEISIPNTQGHLSLLSADLDDRPRLVLHAGKIENYDLFFNAR